MTPEDRYRYTKGGVKLAILGTFIFAIYLVERSMGETETAAYRTLDECLKDSKFGPDDCKSSFETARAEHLKNAPSYQNREDCEEEFGTGHCEQTSSMHGAGGGHYVPYQSGYLIGQPEKDVNGVYYPAVPASALYESSHVSGFVNAAGVLVTNKVGGFKMTYGNGALVRPDATTTTLARSGFGTRHSSAS
ncbi:uncharacterized protein YgiB involved in biofilm formation [Rhizobium sp. BK529]|uniref:DUF1190 domain-containing protein n=1 Tax=unclassified Rhizobium TaxID=2613769 RepID=UPI00104853E1|nr:MULTISPECIES: DUF1190 domain-containing protein [unclassified Rhizobium]MBB3591177.1 uncharacterized protein YgiB involved in biofilm formation [Rhizobium sp. BK529]TCS08868.1 uncharacterized protein YgiB involved in biofilm formation [Rhizobium sp. BK418]